MGFEHLHRPVVTASASFDNAASVTRAHGLSRGRPDYGLLADCRSLTCEIGTLLKDIEKTARSCSDEQGHAQALLCNADNNVIDLIGRIIVTRAATYCGVQSKHAAADLLLSIDWSDDPSPYRDRLLLSFVLDAVRHSYPTVSNGHAFVGQDRDATTTVVVRANTCLALIKELAAGFAQKDQEANDGPVDQDGLDLVVLALKDQKKTAVEALVGIRAFSADAIHAKRVVLRRMLEAGLHDSDANYWRVQLARSYFSDLKTFLQANAREGHEALSGHHTIWGSLSSSFRWLTSTVHLR